MKEKWFSLDIKEIEKKLKTNAASGLSRKAARSRGNRGGGHLFYIPFRSPWHLFLELFTDVSLVLLLLGAVFALFFGKEEYFEGIPLVAVIVCNLIFCGIMYLRSQRMMESLSSFFYPMARVIRSGRLFHTDSRNVVVGDVILLEPGDVLCCDARLVSSDKLHVKMRVKKDKYIELDKNADTVVDEREQRAWCMPNMVHAGSIIEKGNARAIVTAQGKYTYLGAMTGGIALPMSDEPPVLLKRMRKQFFTVNIAMLIAVFPFTVLSLLFGKMLSVGDSPLSVAFLCGLSVAATVMSQLICTLFKLYYTDKIRKLLLGRNASVIKSVEAFDKLASADYIFMTDGCAVTDGILHFERAVCAEGELRNYQRLNKTAITFAEYAYIYHATATQMLTTGAGRTEAHFYGIREFIEKSRIDVGALKIRCAVSSYSSGNMTTISERVCFTDKGETKFLNVSHSKGSIKNCRFIMLGGVKQPFSTDGIRELEKRVDKYEAAGLTPIFFTVASNVTMSDECFIGMIVLKEGIDESLEKNIFQLAHYGCKVISFVSPNAMPKIPAVMLGNGVTAKNTFIINKLPITYNFGKISAYSGFGSEDIGRLIDFAHSKHKSVVVIGFSEGAADIADKADGFITASAINPKISGYLDEEITTTEISGQYGGVTCPQTVKEKADCIISRPSDGRGGLAAIIEVFGGIREVRRNISDYLRYMLSSNIICVLMVALPMLFGNAILDARHIMLCAFVFNMFTFFTFMLRKQGAVRRNKKDYCSLCSVTDYFKGDLAIVIPSAAASLWAILSPLLLDLIIGGYDYKQEFLFIPLVLLHIAASVMVQYGDDWSKLKYVYKNVLLLVEIGIAVLITAFAFAFVGFGGMLGFSDGFMEMPYFILSFTPIPIYVLLFIWLNQIKRN